MCGIFGMFDLQPGDDVTALRRQALELSRRQRHRGPDWSGVFMDAGAILVHERLAIVDPDSGAQPIRSRDGQLALAVNGEIYNHRELRAGVRYDFTTGSDCEVINALYREGADACGWIARLNGIFAFALWDAAARRYLIARDPIGVCPLYWGHDAQGRLCVASEMKALVGVCADLAEFPPGHVYDSASGELRRYYDRPWRDYAATRGHSVPPARLREALERAVHR
ncbi:MAG: asparagine synthase B, partial [Rhodanobacteraceae bacterium]